MEVETPLHLRTPALELHIDAEATQAGFLRTSPELHMKRLLCAGFPLTFQIGPCFRLGEKGALHQPEYSMLEFYRSPGNYLDILGDTQELLLHCAQKVLGKPEIRFNGQSIALDKPWAILNVCDLFQQHAGWNPAEEFDADRFNLDLVEKVEPALPADRPVILKDFPAEQAAMAKLKDTDPKIAERWELYLGGIEIGNAYSELLDSKIQRERFEAWSDERVAAQRETYPLDEAFLEALNEAPSTAGGIAIGMDRLVMLFADKQSLDDVLPFRDEP